MGRNWRRITESAEPGILGGVWLPIREYRAEFRAAQWAIAGQESWKLERRQHFREPGFASREAFARGDWNTALRLMEGEREYLAEFSAKAAQLGIVLSRVRVVETPIDPYLQWELHLLKLRAECGELIRVLAGGQVSEYEANGPLPEMVTLGSSALYHVRYDDAGELTGRGGVHLHQAVPVALAPRQLPRDQPIFVNRGGCLRAVLERGTEEAGLPDGFTPYNCYRRRSHQ